jgi:hypothetical protein
LNGDPLTAERQRLRDLAVVALFACLIFIPFYGMPYHIDEPIFLRFAEAINAFPSRPFNAALRGNSSLALWQVNDGCPLSFDLLALALKATGGGEWFMRLFFLPLDLIAAIGLYLLAGRFIKRPLWPTLIVMATPAYFLDMGHLMGEKFAAAFGFIGLYALVKGIDEERPLWFWLSALLISATILAKVSICFLLLPCLAYCAARGLSMRRIAAYLAVVSVLPLGYLVYYTAAYGSMIPFIVYSSKHSAVLNAGYRAAKIRAFLAFIGGCGVVTAFWPFAAGAPRRRELCALIGAMLILYSPLFDYGRPVRPFDRVLGAALAAGALWGLWNLFKARQSRAWSLWTAWILGGSVVMLGLWMMSARMILFLLPPLIFASAEALELRWESSRLSRFYALSLALALMVSVPLALVDYHYASVQRDVAQLVKTDYSRPGRRLWVTGSWGFQYYMEEIGARDIDVAQGSWSQVRPGDAAVVSWVNSGAEPAPRSLRAKYAVLAIEDPIPLRLFGRRDLGIQAGFYSSGWGFLPYTLSRLPLDRFLIIEVLKTAAARPPSP